MGISKGRESGEKKNTIFEYSNKTSILMAAYDIIVSFLAYFAALWIRFDCYFSHIPNNYLAEWQKFAPIYAVVCVIVFMGFKLYRSIWRFASFSELERILGATILLGAFHAVAITALFGRMPMTYYIGGIMMQATASLAVRFAYRFVNLIRQRNAWDEEGRERARVMLIGAGAAGQMILRDIQNAREISDRVCCIIDDDASKHGRYIDGIPIVGGRDDILANVEKYRIQKIFIAIPSASAQERRDILDICKETPCELKNLPGMYQLVSGNVTVSTMRKVSVEDLLGREPVKADMDEIFEFIQGKTILVTGGGGSIGSELCRQIASHSPKQLIIFDIYENNAHAISLELRDKYPELNLKVLIGSVRDSRRINQVFEKYRPDVVYHAAAHKHVPMMEYSPCEAIKNNVIGTYKTAYAAMKNGCKRFVLISTDKAVNPTNIMGASKRLCEMVIQYFDSMVRSGRAEEIRQLHVHDWDEEGCMRGANALRTEFVAVRFGNVLGSNGSVVPRFREQIAAGGPVTVTHPDIIRYFMTIPEAASLVLQAGTYAKGGEIFVLDMGSPVKIDTLARNLIKLSGLRPDIDIKIEYTGLRPGEKLYEEKLMSEEGLRKTSNNLIHIGQPIPFDMEAFPGELAALMATAYAGDEARLRDLVRSAVPTYHPECECNNVAGNAVYQQQAKLAAMR